MGKLSKLRRDIIKQPEHYQQLARKYPGGVRIVRYKDKSVRILPSSWTKSHHNYIKSVLKELGYA